MGKPYRGVSWMALTFAAAALFGAAADPAPWGQPKTLPASGKRPVAASPMVAPSAPDRDTGPDPPIHAPRTGGSATSSIGHIRIPAIGVDARVIPLGLAPDGSLQVPQDYGLAGWWTGGPFPGEPGPAVVVGHVDSKAAGPAVFYWLQALRPGDLIIVWRAGEARSRFVVRSLEWYAKTAFPTRRVYGSVPGPALRLITCGGAFDRSTGHYVDNLVVFAVPET
jgi:hypothetical protein